MPLFLRRLATLPLKLLDQILFFVDWRKKEKLHDFIWKIGLEPEYGTRMISHIWTDLGAEAGRSMTAEVLNTCRHCLPAALAALLELHKEDDIQAGIDWIEQAQRNEYAQQERLLYPKLIAGELTNEYDREAVIGEILDRKDLPMNVTRLALTSQADLLLEQKRWDEAKAVVNRILSIQSDNKAFCMQWILSEQAGDLQGGQQWFRQFRKHSSELDFHFFRAQGLVYLGRNKEAFEPISWLVEKGNQRIVEKTFLNKLFCTDEFQEFHKQRLEGGTA